MSNEEEIPDAVITIRMSSNQRFTVTTNIVDTELVGGLLYMALHETLKLHEGTNEGETLQ